MCEDEGWSLENGEGIAVDFLTVIFSAVVIFLNGARKPASSRRNHSSLLGYLVLD